MNKDNLKTLIETVEDAAEKGEFNLNTYVYNRCGTPACIAGYAALLLDPQVYSEIAPEPPVPTSPRPSRGRRYPFGTPDEWRSFHSAMANRSRKFHEALAKYLDISVDEANEIAAGFEHLDEDYYDTDTDDPETALSFMRAMYANGRTMTWEDHWESLYA